MAFSRGEIEWRANDKTEAIDVIPVDGTIMNRNAVILRQFKVDLNDNKLISISTVFHSILDTNTMTAVTSRKLSINKLRLRKTLNPL